MLIHCALTTERDKQKVARSLLSILAARRKLNSAPRRTDSGAQKHAPGVTQTHMEDERGRRRACM